MKTLKPYLKPFLIIGVILLLIVILSWIAFPGWRAQTGGLWTLIGVATVGVAAIAKDTLTIAKTLKELQEPSKKATSDRPNQKQRVKKSERVRQVGKKGATQKQHVNNSKEVTQELS